MTEPGVVVHLSPEARGHQTIVPDASGSPYDAFEVARLRAQDRSVRETSAAQLAVAGHLARGYRTEYTIGPDGHRYAVNSDVELDTSPGLTPQDTLERAARVRRAALLGRSTSDDLAQAATASRLAALARLEIARSRTLEARREAASRAPDRPLETAGQREARDHSAQREIHQAERQAEDAAEQAARLEAVQAES